MIVLIRVLALLPLLAVRSAEGLFLFDQALDEYSQRHAYYVSVPPSPSSRSGGCNCRSANWAEWSACLPCSPWSVGLRESQAIRRNRPQSQDTASSVSRVRRGTSGSRPSAAYRAACCASAMGSVPTPSIVRSVPGQRNLRNAADFLLAPGYTSIMVCFAPKAYVSTAKTAHPRHISLGPITSKRRVAWPPDSVAEGRGKA